MASSSLPLESLCSDLCGFLRKHVVAEHTVFDDMTPLREIGVDSVSLVEMLLFIERRFGTEIPDSMLRPSNAKLLRRIPG